MIVSKCSRMIYILPGKQEMELARRVRDGASNKEKVRIEMMDIADLKVCLSRASLVVSNDTGPRHMADALGRPYYRDLWPYGHEVYRLSQPLHVSHIQRRGVQAL